MSEELANKLISRDRKSEHHHEQHVEKCLHRADYFIRNVDVTEKINASVERFIKLVHGTNRITPTNDEIGLYSAQSAALQSACLSRQVGASIMDDDGNILSTGCNDVPKSGGGLYNAESNKDLRCYNMGGGQCYNDLHKSHLELEFENILAEFKIENRAEIAKRLLEESKAKSIIEYSRAIHAEMAAIMAMARSSTNSTISKTLYCTTYPCHNCARHIVASGIKRVVYIEPYEKSLALDLHSDSICHPESGNSEGKVLFENFEGVSPKRYTKFFGFHSPRKDGKGKAIFTSIVDSYHVDTQYLDGYVDYELKVVGTVEDKVPELRD
ncbi:deaminase [Shewanella sp.]|uniref:deaminase n=1 Tax=Shewanella sp. TaxID=50422 RepID=UPI003A97500F